MAGTERRTLCASVKFTGNQSDQANAYRDGIEFALKHTMTSGDDDHWTELEYRKDGNGNLSWYVELHSCPPDWPESPFSR